MGCPVATWVLKAWPATPSPFSSFPFILLPLRRDCLCPSRSRWIGSPSWFVDSIYCFSMLPSPVWCVCSVWVAPGWSIPWVYLSTGVVTAVRVATPEEASARSDVIL
ncbi:hypothetical protein Taro_037593 [Colocasia esculenta]|uniref:Uncharacterized protein n=1 Tax=Colocasia esculenta TaxID=4460 RepID=A0A843WQ61_COLES|nr:hypothetical protein [Colocasia esculenta]